MNDTLTFFAAATAIGIGGSAAIDLWSAGLRRTFHVSTLDYAMLGRWLGHIPRGTFAHKRIASAAAVPGERPLGWLAHYSIGMKTLCEGQRVEAHAHFEKVVKTRAFIWGTYDLSWVFEARLAKDPNWPPWIRPKLAK